MLKVWGRKTSSNVQAVMWCIAELGLPYHRFDIGHKYGGNDTADFLAMNPNGTVPVVQDGEGEPIWETGAILRYLASRYIQGSFWPEDLVQRAGVDKWAEWAKINAAHSFTGPLFWRVVRTAEKDRDYPAIEAALSVLNSKLMIAEAQLSKQAYLAGNELTLADIQFGHLLFRYFDIEIARSPFPAIEAYYQRLMLRPAFIEHVMVSYEELRVK